MDVYLTPCQVIEETWIWEPNRYVGTNTASSIVQTADNFSAFAIILLTHSLFSFSPPPVKCKLH